jgi:glutamate formiminotransferase/formiminotetrahydrofolate cyclodeaminase
MLGWDDRWKEFSDLAAKGRKYINELQKLVDDDTLAFQKLQAAMELPRNSPQEIEKR